MVATITGNIPFHDLLSTTGITASANLTALGTGNDAIGDFIRVTNSDNVLASVTIQIQGTNPVDLTGKYILARLAQNNANRPNDYYLGFLDSVGNERRYTAFTTPVAQDKDVVMVFDLNAPADAVNDPGFDQTDVTTVVWYTKKNGGGVNSGNRLYSIEYIEKLTVTGGTAGAPTNNAEIRAELGVLADFDDDGLEQPRALDDYLSFQHNLMIGDGVAGSTYYDPPPGGLLARQDLPYSNALSATLHYAIIQISDALKRVEFNLADAQSIRNPQTYTRQVFVNNSAGLITWEGASFIDCQSVAMGTGGLTRASITNTTGPITTNGEIVNSAITSSRATGAILSLDSAAASISGTSIDNNNGADYHLELAASISNVTLDDVTFNGAAGTNKVHVLATGGTVTITTSGSTNLTAAEVTSDGATISVSVPTTSFSAPNLTSAVFNRVRARLSLVPGGPVQLNDDNSVSSGGTAFLPSDVNLANNTINVTGTAGKVSAASIIRVHGSDLPAPLDPTGIYYPSGTYDGSDNISLSTTPGGTAVNLTDVGTVPATPDMFMGIWTELDNSLITSGAYTVDLNAAATGAGISLANNDVLSLQAIHHDAPGTGGTAVISEYLEQSFQYAGASITTLETLRQATLTMQLLQELGLDGSQVTGYSFDAENPAKIQIDTSKTNINTLELLAFYYHIQSTEAGMRFARGNVIVENANRIKLLGEITFDASVPSVMSGPYMFSPNGSWQAPESATITQLVEDTRAVIITEEKPVDLPEEVLQAINSIVYGVGHLIANGGVLTPTQSDQLETLYNATEDGTGLTVFSTASLANAPSGGGGGSVTQQFIRDALTLAPTAGTPAANSIDSQLADIPTVTEFEARTLLAADYFDPAADIVARVTLTDTTTDLTNLPAIPANWLTSAGIDPTAITAFQAGLSTLVNDTAILAAIGAIPTNPLLTTDTRLNNLDATISSRLEDTAYIAPLDATATTAAATAALTAYRPPTRAELTADIASIISQGNTAWITATGFSTFDPGATAVTITQAFPANFATLAISGTGGVTADNMRGTDNANTDFTPLDPEFQKVRNLVAAGL